MRALLFLFLAALGWLVPLNDGRAKDAGPRETSFRLASLDGRSWISPRDSRRTTVIAFWDSACPPCLIELQSLPALALANPNIRFIAAGLEPRDIQRRTLARFGVSETSGIELASATPAYILRLGNTRGALPFASAHTPTGQVCSALTGALTAANLTQTLSQCSDR